MSDKETLAVYAAKAKDYAKLTDTASAKDPSLIAFIDALPQGGRALDLGCGPGASASHMARAGLVVDAFDPVPQMVEMASMHPGVNAQRAGFDDLSGAAIYDGIWANFSLLHAPRADLPRHLATIAEALKTGGRFHIAVKTGRDSHRDSIGRFYTYYTEEELIGLLQDAGFRIADKRFGRDKGLSGEEAPWIALAAYA